MLYEIFPISLRVVVCHAASLSLSLSLVYAQYERIKQSDMLPKRDVISLCES